MLPGSRSPGKGVYAAVEDGKTGKRPRILIEVCVCGCIAAGCFWRLAWVRKRSRTSWEDVVSRLRPEWNAELQSVSERSGREQLSGRSDRRLNAYRAHQIWTMYSNAGVLMHMAAYAARQGHRLEMAALDALRTEAILVRWKLLGCVGKFALRGAEERLEHSLHSATEAYAQLVVDAIRWQAQQIPGVAPVSEAVS